MPELRPWANGAVGCEREGGHTVKAVCRSAAWAGWAAWVLLGALSVRAADAPEAGTRLAVVDVSLVFEKYQKVTSIQTQMDATFGPAEKEFQDKQKKIVSQGRDLEERRAQPDQPEEALLAQIHEYQTQEMAFRKALAKHNEEKNRRYFEEMKSVLVAIRAAIRKEAENGGYRLVLRAPDSLDMPETPVPTPPPPKPGVTPTREDELAQIKKSLEPQSSEEAVARFRRNPVLYGREAVDITPAVLKTLNENYTEESTPKPPTFTPKRP
jgi:Skp family chaperone for outer membrane proteins